MEGYKLILTLVAVVSLSEAQNPAPANILVAPRAPVDFYGGRLSIPCAAIGWPAPNITWSSQPLGISDFDDYYGTLAVNVATRQVTVGEGTITISILEICNANYTLAGMGELITCSADNGLPTNSSFLSSVSVSFVPEVTEPVSLVAAPQNRYLYNGSRIVATCVARGSPKASITWSAPSLNISDFNNNYVSFTSFAVSSVDVPLGPNDTIHTVSTLEICADNVEVLAQYFVPIWCSARNSPSMPPSVASFTPQPYNEFVSFSVRARPSTAEVTFELAGPYDSTFLGCFLNKLIFSNNANTVSYQPVYAGTCMNSSPNQVIASIDPRDYIDMIQLGFFLTYTSDIVVYTAMEYYDFGLPFAVTPINSSSPLPPITFLVSTELPFVTGFDMDLSSRLLFIHFTGVMEFTTFLPNHFVFVTTDSTGQQQQYTLTNSQPLSNTGSRLYSFCISLSMDDITAMRQGGFCTSAGNCTVFFSSNLASDVYGNGVSDIAPTNPLPVALFTGESPPALPDLYMEVEVDVSGCQRTRVLEENEMYISKSGERLVNVRCVARSPEINPIISWTPLPEAMSDFTMLESSLFEFDWPNRATLSFADGLPENYQGLFNCTSNGGNSVSNYIIDINPYIALDNDTYNVRLYDDVSIPVLFGSYPPIDLRDSQVDVNLFRAGGVDPAPVEPTVDFQSPYLVVLSYSNIDYRINEVFEGLQVRIARGGVILAAEEINFYVGDPAITIIPPVAAVLPTDTRITFRCETNSPDLPVIWVGEDLRTEFSAGPTYSVDVPSGGLDGQTFICAVRDPTPNSNNPFFVAYKNSTVRSVQEPLTAWRDGILLTNNSVTVTNRFSGSLNLTCLGHYPTNNVDLSWIIVPDGAFPQSIVMNTTRYNVSYEENLATLMIDNTVEPYRGTVKCVSGRSGMMVNVFVRGEEIVNPVYCPNGDRDEVWGIVWNEVLVGGRDIQACRSLDGTPTDGFASRDCTPGGVWDSSVDVSGCSSQAVSDINNKVNDLFENSDRLPASEVNSQISDITRSLLNVTTVGSMGGAQFTQDLQLTNDIIERVVTVLNDGVRTAPPGTSFQNELADVLSNLLHMDNIQGWVELEKTSPGTGQTFLINIQSYGYYISWAIINTNIDTSQYGEDGVTIEREYISYNVRSVPSTDKVDIVYPPSDSPAYSEGRVRLSADLLEEQQATGVINIVIQNLGAVLPDPSNNNQNTTSLVGSNIISTQLMQPRQVPFDNNLIEIYLVTEPILGAVNPRGAYFVSDLNGAGSWETQGLSSGSVVNGGIGESKNYQVSFSARLAGAFAVIVDQVTVEFNLTVPVYVGCGVAIFSAVMSLFCLLLSCFVDSVRKYFTTAFFIHVSFIFSLLAAYVSFLVGIELGLGSRIGCAAVAGILHYFFTAAFTWLLFEAILVMMFGTLSKSWGTVFLLFFLGWGIPAIPTAVSLGLLHGQYGTSQHCWFFFDGVVTSPVVLGFIIPKLVLIALTVIVLVIGVCTNFKFQLTKTQPHIKRPYACMLWFVWLSTVLMLLLLAASWVFLMLLVNVYGLASSTLGWIFMGVTIALGIYLFLFSFVVLIANQKIDYKYMWEEKSDTYVDDPHKGRDYEIMTTPPSPKLGPVSRPIVIDNPVFDEKAPPLAEAPPPGEDDSFEDTSDDENVPEKPTNLDDPLEDGEDDQPSDLNTPLVNN